MPLWVSLVFAATFVVFYIIPLAICVWGSWKEREWVFERRKDFVTMPFLIMTPFFNILMMDVIVKDMSIRPPKFWIRWKVWWNTPVKWREAPEKAA